MADYQPLDISSLCNADASLLGDNVVAPTGARVFRGLPFLVGSASGAGDFLVAFGGPAGSMGVTIPIGSTARHVIVAHRLLHSDIMDGGPVGDMCAHYNLVYADGTEDRTAIRERFEIGILPPWGQHAFIAYPDTEDGLHPRYEGRWDSAGGRQTEATQGNARFVYLWVWHNPRPDAEIACLRVEPNGPEFFIAGVTLGHVDENPFRRSAKREVKIVLPNDADAKRPFDLDVEVDRGIAQYQSVGAPKIPPIVPTPNGNIIATLKGSGQESLNFPLAQRSWKILFRPDWDGRARIISSFSGIYYPSLTHGQDVFHSEVSSGRVYEFYFNPAAPPSPNSVGTLAVSPSQENAKWTVWILDEGANPRNLPFDHTGQGSVITPRFWLEQDKDYILSFTTSWTGDLSIALLTQYLKADTSFASLGKMVFVLRNGGIVGFPLLVEAGESYRFDFRLPPRPSSRSGAPLRQREAVWLDLEHAPAISEWTVTIEELPEGH